ncbi:MAG: hypothetical protein KF770_08510 [Anaerolineae bacterium]|nr:hypothetical protein [Anaerolineae bacterium]
MAESTDSQQSGQQGPSGGSSAGAATAVLQQRITELEAKVDTLEGDNYKLREDRRDLRGKVRDLEGKTPEEGGVILNKEQAALWTAYQQIGKPVDLKAGQEKLATLERQTAIANAARYAGPGVQYNDQVLGQLVPESAALMVKTVKDAEGQESQAAFIKIGDGEHSLAEYAAAHWEVFMPALVNVTGNGRNLTQQSTGTTFIPQKGQQPPPKPKEVTPEEIRAQKLATGRYGSI